MDRPSGKLEIVHNRYGYIINSNKTALALSFKLNYVQCYALAVRKICYVDEFQSEDLYNDFYPGDQVNFEAVLDSETPLPDVWKITTLWTKGKPVPNVSMEKWDKEIANLYNKCEHYQYLLIFSPCSSSCENTKILLLERKSVIFLCNILREEMKNNNIFSTNDCDLNTLLSYAKANVKHYITTAYPNLQDFFRYHSDIFKISSINQQIFPPKHLSVVENYIYDDLPEKLKDKDYKQKNDFEMLIIPQSFDLEIDCDAIWHFATIISEIKRSEKYLFSTRSRSLENLLDEAPKKIRSHIKTFYQTLGEFIEFHDDIFHINESQKIFPGAITSIKNCLRSKLSLADSTAVSNKFKDCESELKLNNNFHGGKANQWKHYGKVNCTLDDPKPKLKSSINKVKQKTKRGGPGETNIPVHAPVVNFKSKPESKDLEKSREVIRGDQQVKPESLLTGSHPEEIFQQNTNRQINHYPELNDTCKSSFLSQNLTSDRNSSNASASRQSNTCGNRTVDDIYFSEEEGNEYSSTSWIPFHRMDERDLKAQLTRLLEHFNMEVKEKNNKDFKDAGMQTLSTGPIFSMCQCDEDLTS